MDEFLHNLAMSKAFINIIQNPEGITKKTDKLDDTKILNF